MGTCSSSKDKKDNQRRNNTQPQQPQKNTEERNPYLEGEDTAQPQKKQPQKGQSNRNPYLEENDSKPQKSRQKNNRNPYLEEEDSHPKAKRQNKPQNKPKMSSTGNIEQDCLNAHNEYRKKHHSPPLELNSELSKIAKSYAQKLAATNSFQHSKNKWNGKDLGENLFMCKGYSVTGENMTTDWYNEINDWTYGNDFTSGTGHFTQVVWKDTKLLGVGVAQAKDGSWYGVCNYYPPGNYLGKFNENVLRP
ncbi:MAG: CAP domain-containing protein [archaeon]|nr:CAP domain-containing protein [archaeon]